MNYGSWFEKQENGLTCMASRHDEPETRVCVPFLSMVRGIFLFVKRVEFFPEQPLIDVATFEL